MSEYRIVSSDELYHARSHKYIRREPDGHGGWKYYYYDTKDDARKANKAYANKLKKDGEARQKQRDFYERYGTAKAATSEFEAGGKKGIINAIKDIANYYEQRPLTRSERNDIQRLQNEHDAYFVNKEAQDRQRQRSQNVYRSIQNNRDERQHRKIQQAQNARIRKHENVSQSKAAETADREKANRQRRIKRAKKNVQLAVSRGKSSISSLLKKIKRR